MKAEDVIEYVVKRIFQEVPMNLTDREIQSQGVALKQYLTEWISLNSPLILSDGERESLALLHNARVMETKPPLIIRITQLKRKGLIQRDSKPGKVELTSFGIRWCNEIFGECTVVFPIPMGTTVRLCNPFKVYHTEYSLLTIADISDDYSMYTLKSKDERVTITVSRHAFKFLEE